MKANIKGVWTEYNYAIDCCHTALNSVNNGLKEEGYEVLYLGSSKTIQLEDKIINLQKRSHFFIINEKTKEL